MRWKGTTILLLVVAALLAVGCGQSEVTADGPTEPTLPVGLAFAADPAALLGPGAQVADGLQVQEGSWLVGTAFPGSRGEDGPAGWQALFVVDGDPVEVWDSYASTLGIGDEASALHACVAMRVEPYRVPEATTDTVLAEFNEGPPTRFLSEPRIDGENRFRCEATVGGRTMVLGYGASRSPAPTCVTGDRAADAQCPFTAESHLFISAGSAEVDTTIDHRSLGTDELRFNRTWASHVAAGRQLGDTPNPEERIPVPDGPVIQPDFEVDGSGSRLPEVGERFDEGLDGFLGDGWVVPEGGRSLVAPVELIACNSGLVAVLDLAGAPAAALAPFDDAEESDDAPFVTEGTDDRGREWVHYYIGSAGGHHLQAVAVPSDAGRSLVLVTECGD